MQDIKRGNWRVGRELYGNSVLSAQFFYEPKTALKVVYSLKQK